MADKIGRGEQISEGERDYLDAVEERDRCFENVDASLWKNVEAPAQ